MLKLNKFQTCTVRQISHEMTAAVKRPGRWTSRRFWATGSLALLLTLTFQVTEAKVQVHYREQLIPILGVAMEEEPIGVVTYVSLAFAERDDHAGLTVQFRNTPGRFSPMAQTSVTQAIYRAAQSLGLSTDSWSVRLTVPYRNLTVYGESLSAMVGLSVVALAEGDFIANDRVMTGTITPDGHIGPVGSVPLKVAAANEAHIRRVLVPDEQDTADADWRTPFLMQVSPVGSVDQAYQALTSRSLLR